MYSMLSLILAWKDGRCVGRLSSVRRKTMKIDEIGIPVCPSDLQGMPELKIFKCFETRELAFFYSLYWVWHPGTMWCFYRSSAFEPFWMFLRLIEPIDAISTTLWKDINVHEKFMTQRKTCHFELKCDFYRIKMQYYWLPAEFEHS